MHPPRPGRLPGCTYLGRQCYFLTVCARRPPPPFLAADVVAFALGQLRQCMTDEALAVLAYCFMPDHVHLVIQGASEHADLRRAVARWKQVTGYWYSKRSGRHLWLTGYHDHVLRGRDPLMVFVRYVLRNPVKAGLAVSLGQYPFAGSDVFTIEELSEVLRD